MMLTSFDSLLTITLEGFVDTLDTDSVRDDD